MTPDLGHWTPVEIFYSFSIFITGTTTVIRRFLPKISQLQWNDEIHIFMTMLCS